MKRLKFLILCILYSVQCLAQRSPYGASEISLGAAVTHTNDYNTTGNYNGEGGLIHAYASLIGLLTNTDNNHKLVLGDYLGSSLFMGIRQASVKNTFGNIPTALGEGFWWGGTFEWGLQGCYKLTSRIDIGLKYYFNDVFDNARDLGNGPGKDDNTVIKYMVRYDKVMAEYGYVITPYSAGDKNQKWYSLCLRYFMNPAKKGNNVGIRWEDFSAPKLQNGTYNYNNISYPVYSGYSSFRIEAFYGWMF